MKEFEQRNVQVLAVLPETVEELLPSVETARGTAAFPVLSDLAATVSALYGQGGYGTGVDPATFVIGRDGVIRFEHRAGQDFSQRPVFDRPTVDKVLRVLDGMGEKRLLCEALKVHNDREIREAMEFVLGPPRGEPQAAVAALAEALRDEDVKVRRGAAAGLWYLSPQDEAAVAALGKALEDRDTKVRLIAAETLGAVGRKAKSALPALIRLLRDEDEGVRSAAVGALWRVGPGAKAIVAALVNSIREDDPATAKAALLAASRIGQGATEAHQALLELHKHEKAHVREWAATILGQLKEPDE